MPAAARSTTSETINLRVTAERKALIDQAAAVLGKSRTEFMLETVGDAAENVLLDQRLFPANAEKFSAFQAALDAPVAPSPGLARTLAARAPWNTSADE